MQKAALYAACGLVILAAVLPFTPLGVWAIVPMVAAIAGAVVVVGLGVAWEAAGPGWSRAGQTGST